MNTKKDWNPELYLKFNKERTQPSIDLAIRINIENPRKIIDIGCGPGNSTNILSKRWPDSKIVGIDNSAAMIESAKNNYPDIDWRIADASRIETNEKYDIAFSNATIQWIPDQKKLLADLIDILEDNGALAIQVPLFNAMPVSRVIESVSLKQRWKKKTDGASDVFTFHNSDFYYDALSVKVNSIEMWETSYFHIMPSHQTIIEMLKSTGLKPFLDRLDSDEDKIDFEKDVLSEIKQAYPAQNDSNILFPFKRLFFIAYKNV